MNKSLMSGKLRSALPLGAVAIVFLVLLLLLVYQLRLSYRDHVMTAEINMSNFAAIFEARIDATLRRADADLLAMSIEIPLGALNAKAGANFADTINDKLEARLYRMDEMVGYQVFDANGNVLYSSLRLASLQANISDRPYFQELRQRSVEEPVFSSVFSDAGKNGQYMAVARSIRDQHGAFVGVIAGLIDLDHYRHQFQSMNLGKNGVLAANHPVVLGMNAGAKRLHLHYEVYPENVRRIMAVQSMPKYPFYVAVGAAEDDVLAGWRAQVMVVAISSLLLFAIVGALLYRLSRMHLREAGILSDLARRESQFRNLARMVPVGICHFDAAGYYTYVNERYLTITGRRQEELMRAWWWKFVHPDDRPMMLDAWWRNEKRPSPFICEYRFVCPDGQWVDVFGEIQAEVDPRTGCLLGYVAAITDVIQRKRAEEALQMAQAQAESASVAKTRFLAAASHDLRQPIQAINLFKDALERTELNDEQRTFTGFLSRSVRALNDLLYSLLDFSRLDAGQIRPQMRTVLVGDLFKEIDAEFSSLAREKNLRFKLFYPFEDVITVTDPDLLMRVLRNLIDNALKYTERGGVLVAFRKHSERAIIQVWDTGVGIEEGIGNQIFEECFQIGNSQRNRARGIGLGLSIVRRTVDLLGGEVRYRSRFGRGSMFEISWPLAVAVQGEAIPVFVHPGEESAYREVDFSRLKGCRVALVEDDPVVAKSVELSLGTYGMAVTVYGSAEQALSAQEIVGADCYITDFNLPGMSGVEFLETLRQRAGSVQAIVVTGKTRDEVAMENDFSAWKVLYKPLGLPELLASIDEIVGTSKN